MKKYKFYFIFIVLTFVFALSSGRSHALATTWQTKTPTPNNDIFLSTTGTDGKIYSMSFNGNNPSFQAYSPNTNSWATLPNAPTPRFGVTLTAGLNGLIYAIGGSNDAEAHYYDYVEAYNPTTGTWICSTNDFSPGCISSTLAPMPTARIASGTTDLDGKIYVLGGHNAPCCSGFINVAEEYNPSTNSWTILPALSIPKDGGEAVADVNGKIYFIGGVGMHGINCQDSTCGGLDDVEIFNPNTNSWSMGAHILGGNREQFGIARGAGNKIYVIGGAHQIDPFPNPTYEFLSSVDVYDPATDSWASAPSLSSARYRNSSATDLNGNIYTIGGIDGASNLLNLVQSLATAPISLNVPLLKQTSLPWKNQIYDTAYLWNPKDPSVNSWGCAVTSGAMVFKYHGINKLPNNTNLDPGTLNSWLKNQKDGYIGNGLLNWLALSRLSKLAKNINGLSYDALEYSRTDGNASEKLEDALSNNLPGILAEPGHFIVGKGINNEIFSINDPYYSKTSLSDYGNSFQNLGVYMPSHTDLSYIMLTVEPNINIQLLDSSNISVGNSLIDGPIINPTNSNQKSGSLKILYFQKPPNGNYKIILTTGVQSEFNLKTYLYDKNGDVFIKSYTDTVSSTQSKTITFQFNGQGDLYNKKATFLSTILDIEKFRAQKLITNDSTKISLEDLMTKAFVQSVLKSDEGEQKYFSDFIDYLSQNSNKILEPANSSLLYDINYLSSHL